MMNSQSQSTKILWILIPIVLVNGIGFTSVFPILPFLIGKYLPPSQVAMGMSALLSVFAACTFVAAPVFGALSDRFGRKIILILSLLGSVIGYVLLGIGGSLWILFVGRIIDGLTAGNISTIYAYISDSSPAQERTKWFSYLGAAMGIGCMIGSVLGGVLGSISIPLPFYVTSGIFTLSLLAICWFLPESLAQEKRAQRIALKEFNTWVHFKEIFAVKKLLMLLLMGAMFYIAMEIYISNITIYLKDIFNWGPASVGSILTVVGAGDILSRGLLLPQLLKRFREMRVSQFGIALMVMGFMLIVLSQWLQASMLIYGAVACIAIGEGLFESIYNGRLSQAGAENIQGKLQGVNQSLQSAYRVLIPFVAVSIYLINPTLLYLLASILCLGVFFLLSKRI